MGPPDPEVIVSQSIHPSPFCHFDLLWPFFGGNRTAIHGQKPTSVHVISHRKSLPKKSFFVSLICKSSFEDIVFIAFLEIVEGKEEEGDRKRNINVGETN